MTNLSLPNSERFPSTCYSVLVMPFYALITDDWLCNYAPCLTTPSCAGSCRSFIHLYYTGDPLPKCVSTVQKRDSNNRNQMERGNPNLSKKARKVLLGRLVRTIDLNSMSRRQSDPNPYLPRPIPITIQNPPLNNQQLSPKVPTISDVHTFNRPSIY
jgi:hypothetical protein